MLRILILKEGLHYNRKITFIRVPKRDGLHFFGCPTSSVLGSINLSVISIGKVLAHTILLRDIKKFFSISLSILEHNGHGSGCSCNN